MRRCHAAAIAVAHTASATRDIGFAGALSTAAASMPAIAHKRGPSAALAARSAASDADAKQAAPGAPSHSKHPPAS